MTPLTGNMLIKLSGTNHTKYSRVKNQKNGDIIQLSTQKVRQNN